MRAQQAAPGTLSDAIRFFGHEKSAAEQYGVIFLTVAKDNTGLYVRGIKLYADAKAEFDGLIAELRFDLKSGQDPARSAKFNEALEEAAEKRIAFTSFVSAEVDKLPGARPGLPDVIEAVPQLVKAITDAGISIWNAFRRGPQGKPRCDTERARAPRMATVLRNWQSPDSAAAQSREERRWSIGGNLAEGSGGARCDPFLGGRDELRTRPPNSPPSRSCEIETGKHGAAIKRIDTDAENRFAVTASDDKTVRVWSLPEGRLMRLLRLPIDQEAYRRKPMRSPYLRMGPPSRRADYRDHRWTLTSSCSIASPAN